MGAFCGDVPTEVFLDMIGLPAADGPMMAAWVADVFDHMHDVQRQPMLDALARSVLTSHRRSHIAGLTRTTRTGTSSRCCADPASTATSSTTTRS